jgi:adenylate cyclase class 2
MIEVEIKAYAPDLGKVEKRLKEMKAKFLGEHREGDVYFASPIRDMSKGDEALRVRYASGKAFITYKGPKIDRVTKTREELEVEVSSAPDAESIFKRLGFTPVAVIKKVRRVYDLNEFWVMLDEVSDVGSFVEIEAKNGDMDLRQRGFDLLRDLGLDRTERRSYLELFLAGS